jgi:hypothetical protein
VEGVGRSRESNFWLIKKLSSVSVLDTMEAQHPAYGTLARCVRIVKSGFLWPRIFRDYNHIDMTRKPKSTFIKT